MKKLLLIPSVLFAAFAISSCDASAGAGESDSTHSDSVAVETKKATFEDVCKDASKVSVTVKGYKYQMSGDYEFASEFVVKDAKLTWNNDSSAVLVLKNYKPEEMVGDRKDDQIDITVELNSRHGKKIGPGTYNHSDYDADYSSSTTMMTSKGKVWFNWVAGMDKQGSVTLSFIEGDNACGTFALAVENPTNEQIGTVRINGNFTTAK
jgi:hypothetical protein